MAEPQLPKLMVWVRFPSSAPKRKSFVLAKDFFYCERTVSDLMKSKPYKKNRIKQLYEIIEPADDSKGTIESGVYDSIMLVCIVASMIPLTVKSSAIIFTVIDKITVAVFIVDYLMRLITADEKLHMGVRSYLFYPLMPMAIIDLLSILPSLMTVSRSFKALRLLRVARTLKVFRSFKFFRYSKNVERIMQVIHKQMNSLTAVFSLAIFYVLFTALIMFNIEPDTFENFWTAIYWAAISLTSVGYGDITPVTGFGRMFTVLSAFVGVAIIALPSGIITAGYMEILQEEKNKDK